jgi:hypothetical protein
MIIISIKIKIGEDVARSAFRANDRNRNGYLDVNDANRAYGYMERLYY